MRNQQATTERRSRSHIYWLSGIVVAILLIVMVGTYKEFHRWSGPAPNKSSFDLSFVAVPSKPVPKSVYGGDGMTVSITIKAWDPEYYKKFLRDGICIIPTSIKTTQTLSIHFMPSSPSGFQATGGVGPSSFEDVVNKYLQQHHLAQLDERQMNQIGSIHGNYKNVSFPVAIGNSGFPLLQTNDIRLVILDVRERGDQFKVMWSKVYSPMNLSK